MKPAASLSASLLARKGDANPSRGLEPIGYVEDVHNNPDVPPVAGTPAPAAPPVAGSAVPAPAATANAAPQAITPAAAGDYPAAYGKRPVGSSKRVAMTLRLDHEQHLKLRLFSAHVRQSSQDVMLEALEAYIKANAPQSFEAACKSLDS